MRILAVDPGEKRIGLAISDPSGTIANPLTIIKHVSRSANSQTIAQIAVEHNVERIIVGQALDTENQPTSQARRAARLATAIRSQTDIPVELWDESCSTQTAQEALITLGISRSKRRFLDDIAATVILQSYLDAHR
ncbi:MAG: Holliday junction resolvase RuvX [Chloroflexota bacterium]